MERGSARLHKAPVAEDQALVVQHPKRASKSDVTGKGAGVCEYQVSKCRKRQDRGMLPKNQAKDGALNLEFAPQLRTLLRNRAAGCSISNSPPTYM
jgi:hypothetical protein